MDLAEREVQAVTRLHDVAATITPSPEDIRQRAHGGQQRRSNRIVLATTVCILTVVALAIAWALNGDPQMTVVAPRLDPAAGPRPVPTTTNPLPLTGSALLVELLASLEPQITSDPVAVVPADLPADWEFETVSGYDAYSINLDFLNPMAPAEETHELPTVYVCVAPRTESGAMHERCAPPDGEIAKRLEFDDPRVDAVLIGTPDELAPWTGIRFTTDLSEVNW